MRIIVASMHFGAGHTSHLKAYLELGKQCKYDMALLLNRKYIPLFKSINGTVLFDLSQVKKFNPDIVWIYNIGVENIQLIKLCKEIGCKVVYVLHEPYMGIKGLLKEGSYFAKQTAASLLNIYICISATKVVLSSKMAVENCKKYMPNLYKKSVQFPLIFLDAYINNMPRRYFSMVGGYAYAHGSDVFLNFVKESYLKRKDIFFQIVTRDNIEDKLTAVEFQEMIRGGRLLVQQGRPLTEEEMNLAYRQSICTWNGYRRSTQSGVLANSFMQGTPVVASKLDAFVEFIQEGENGEYIDDFSYDSIAKAYDKIKQECIEESCRITFKKQFYATNQTKKFQEIVQNI